MIEINKIYCGNTLDVLKTFPDNFIQCCVTSPPYYGLRDYGIDNQIGLEKTPEQYVENLVKIFQEVKRVLKEDGTLWLNLGDSYNGSGGPGSQYDTKASKGYKGEFIKFDNPNKNIEGLKPKDLIGIPWTVAFALRYDGWYLRSDIIWSKGNPMPESVKDRPTRNHEYVFLLTKNKKYYFDQDSVREPYTQPINRWAGNKLIANGKSNWDEGTGQKIYRDRNMRPNSLGRNIRSVWTINTRPYKGAHFATFPLELPERCIKAGTSEFGSCPICGSTWKRITKKVGEFQRRWSTNNAKESPYNKQSSMQNIYETVEWNSGCNHNIKPIPSIVLDPFNGAGTTCLVAKNLNRQYIGIDLNPEYCKLAENRIK